MTDTIDRQDHERAIAEARREGAEAARRNTLRRAMGVVGAVVILFIASVGIGWTLVARAQEAAPAVIEEIATERQAQMEARIAARSQEAQALAVQLFVFIQHLWEQNESLARIRSNLDAATTQVRLLTTEVNAAFDSPTRNLGTLLDNGPTRATAVLDYAVAIAQEIQRLVPAVVGALKQAEAAAEGIEGRPALQAILDSLDALLEPLIGTNVALGEEWRELRSDVLGWTQRIWADLDQARVDMSGAELSDEFMQRLWLRIF